MNPQNHDLDEDRRPVPLVYTVGHGDRSTEEFLDVLRAAAIACVADVRAYPRSRRHPQFSNPALAARLEDAGIGYCWFGAALGGFRKASAVSEHVALKTAGLRAYAEHMTSAAFQDGIAALLARARVTPTAILCAERHPQHCHRALIADCLVANGVAVTHVLDADYHVLHRLSKLVRRDQGRLIYDQGPPEQMGLALR